MSTQLNLNNINLVMTAGLKSQFPQDLLPQVAMSGRSNVGKSSLINSLLNRKSLARTSATPGKTITINFYEIDKKMHLVDLPGYGYAQRSASEQEKWSTLVEGYVTETEQLRMVIQLVELKVGATKNDDMMLDWMNSSGMPYIIVATKSDKLNKTEYAKAMERLYAHEKIRPDTPIFAYAVKTPTAKQDIWKQIESVIK